MSGERAKVAFFVQLARRDRRSREILLWGEAREKNTIFNAQKMTFVLVYLVLLHLLGARVLAVHAPRWPATRWPHLLLHDEVLAAIHRG